MPNSRLVVDNLLEKNVENSALYKSSDSDLNGVGNFVQGSDANFSKNNIDKLNDTLVFSIFNPTTAKLNVNLFGFTNNLFLPVNPPPNALNPILPPTGVAPVEAAFCPVNDFIYTVDQVGNSVTVVNCATNAVVVTIPMPAGFLPNSVVYCPVNNQMYVGSSVVNIIRIDCATNAIVGVPIVTLGGTGPAGMIYNSLKNTVYAIIAAAASIQEVSCVTNLVISSFIPPGAVALSGIGFSPNTNLGPDGRIYISDAVTGNIFVVNCTTNLTLVTIPTALVAAGQIAFCSVNNFIYVAGFGSNNILTINTITNVPGVTIPGIVAGPSDIAYNFINNLLYVTASATNNFYTINPVTNTVISVTPLGGITPTGVVYNSNDNSAWFIFNATSNVQSFFPPLAPVAVVILNNNISLGEIFNDIMGKPLLLVGMRMIVELFAQFSNNITIDYFSIYGKVDAMQFQPLNYVSPTNRNSLMIDSIDFEAFVDENTDISFDVEPLSKLIVAFTVNRSVDNTAPLFEDITKDWSAGTDKTTNTRMTGNPLADIVLQQEADKILSESGYNSVAQYAFYPRETGNPLADIALLNQAGFI